jgi:acyl-CoA thioester hydrolase
VINDFLIRVGGLDIHSGDVIGLCVDSQCTFKQPLEFPGTVGAGLRVGKLGNSSVRYDIGLFREGASEPAATGRFVHVFVGREDRRPVPVPDRIRQALEGITR